LWSRFAHIEMPPEFWTLFGKEQRRDAVNDAYF
jgi:hypothetical protein